MTLCGVGKNILLVVASVLIWGTIITGLQVFGYTIALAGLVYYGVGYEGIQTYYSATQQLGRKLWEGQPEKEGASPQRSTMLRKATIVSIFALIMILLMAGIAMQHRGATEYIQDVTRDWFDFNW
jgi:hypothetical protein